MWQKAIRSSREGIGTRDKVVWRKYIMTDKKYSANLTGAWFLLYEIKQVVQLLNQGLSEKEIKVKVKEENLFQHKKESSLKRALPTVYRRADLLQPELRKMILEDSIDNGKLINLYAIMEEDLLFKEFMIELIKEKYELNNLFVERKDINSFFIQKSEQNKGFSKYTETTVNKLRQVYLRILVESGVLKDIQTGELNRILFDPYLKQVLENNNAKDFINIFK